MTRGSRLIPASALLACLALGGLQAGRAATRVSKAAGKKSLEASKVKKGRSNMTTLDLTLKLKRTKVITGESLPVEVTISNQGSSPVEVPDPVAGSEFRYTLRSRTQPRTEHYLSYARAYAERYLDPAPSHGAPGQPLAPGAKRVYDEDLADYEVPVIGPGDYDLSVAYEGAQGLVDSVPVAVTITPPRVLRMLTAAGTSENRVAVAFAHHADGRRVTLYQVENEAGRPGDGPAYPRKELASASDLHGLALAVELGENAGRRFWGWMDGRGIGAGVGQGRFVSRGLAPVAHGLGAASLSPVGWQLSNDDALFVGLGASAEGQGMLAVATFNLAAPAAVKTVRVAGPAAPEAWATQYRAAAGDAHIELVTAARLAHAVKITVQSIALGTGKAGTPTSLIERAGPLAAMAISPLGNPSAAGHVDVLFGPDPKTGYMSFLRLPLSGGSARPTWDFSPPKTAAGKRPTLWAIPRAPLDPPMAAAQVGDKICTRRAGGEWSVAVDSGPQVEHLSLEALRDGSVVIVWSDPRFGIRYHTL